MATKRKNITTHKSDYEFIDIDKLEEFLRSLQKDEPYPITNIAIEVEYDTEKGYRPIIASCFGAIVGSKKYCAQTRQLALELACRRIATKILHLNPEALVIRIFIPLDKDINLALLKCFDKLAVIVQSYKNVNSDIVNKDSVPVQKWFPNDFFTLLLDMVKNKHHFRMCAWIWTQLKANDFVVQKNR
jgi:hypothetical protein